MIFLVLHDPGDGDKPHSLSVWEAGMFLSNGVFARPSLGGSLDGSPGA